MTQEEQWAIALKKSQTAARRNGGSIGIRKGAVEESLRTAKETMRRAALRGDAAEVIAKREELIALRAEETALALKELEELYGKVDPRAIEAEIKAYYADCASLTTATGAFGSIL